MQILIVTPAPEGSLSGNRQTARRWANMLHGLGHTVSVVQEFDGQPCDLLVALHATRSAASIARYSTERPDAPLLVALTGTDLYRDLPDNKAACQSLEQASALITLQPLAVNRIPEIHSHKVRVILQSVEPLRDPPAEVADAFQVSVVGHLREVKDPFRTAEAVRLLPEESRVRVLHVGTALQPSMESLAREEEAANPRYRWLGALSHQETLQVIARSRLLVLTSRMEGGAHVIGEGVVHGVPVISSRIDGSIGLLGENYPGYFTVGETAELAGQIRRAETDPAYLQELQDLCLARADDFSPEREGQAWSSLLSGIPR